MANDFSMMPSQVRLANVKGMIFSTKAITDHGYLLNVDTLLPVGEYLGIKVYEDPTLGDDEIMLVFK
jgi:hypothetical protein